MTLLDALTALRDAAAATPLPLASASAAGAARTRDELVGQVDDYLLPRLSQIDAPLLTVIGGSTGAGKSTLVNSLVREDVSTAGVLRPTTRAPVLVCAPDDEPWFLDDRVLPGLSRLTGSDGGAGAGGAGIDGGPGSLRVVTTTRLRPGLALLDAPDIDSVVEANRLLAAQLLAAADLWLFVTTAARYADAVPWDLLHTAQERSTAVAIVLNRVPTGATADISAHLREMLAEQGLARADLFAVREVPLVGGRLPEQEVGLVRQWLDKLASDADARAAVVRATLGGALDSLQTRVPVLETAVAEQVAVAERLRSATRSAYAAAAEDVDEGVRDGSLLRGEVLARWQEVVGTGELMRSLEGRIGRVRDRVVSAVTGRPAPQAALAGALESGVESLVRAAADRGAERSYLAWQGDPAGSGLLRPELGRSSPELAPRAEETVRDWQRGVLDLVASEGAGKRSTARFASFGVNGVGLVVMLAVFAQTGGLTGAEIGVAGGTAALGQRLLEALLGDEAVRRLADRARRDLLDRVQHLLDAEAARYEALLDDVPGADQAERLRSALAEVTRSRAGEL